LIVGPTNLCFLRTIVLMTVVAGVFPIRARAEFADQEALGKFCLMLKKQHLNPFPICNDKTGKGSIYLNDGKVCWTDSAKVHLPGGKYVLTTETSQGKIVSVEHVKAGWKLGGRLEAKAGDVFVNVGVSKIEFEGEQLRLGEYVLFDGTKLVRGSLRPPDPVRVEPRDTNRDKAAALLDEAVFTEGVGDYAGARVKYREVALTYPDTTSGERALAALGRIGEKGPPNAPAKKTGELLPDSETVPDSVFVKEDGQSDEDAAAALLALGKTCKGLNQLKKSRTVLLGLVERYPGTKAARKAIAMLETMRESPRPAAK
jgi:hypothetical protein